jgi:hypothetical protein
MDEKTLKRISDEVDGNTRQYLNNCINNYKEYVEAAMFLFPSYYQGAKGSNKEEDEINLCLSYKQEGDIDSEVSVLNKMIASGCSIPYVYKRVAEIYKRRKEVQQAKDVLIKWFETEYWKIPNMANSSLKMLDMLEKLESK